MYDRAKDLVDGLRSTPDVLEGLLRGVSQSRAQAARGGDESWSVVEVVCHLRDAEDRACERTLAMLNEENPFLAGYDQERWARERGYASSDLREAIDSFVRLRARHVELLAELDAQAWERTGQHEEQGSITIASHILHLVSHDALHAAQIARQLQGQ